MLVDGIDAVKTGMGDRRRADAQVHFGGAGIIEHLDDLLGGVAAHDGVVHDHQALALDGLGQRIELDADAVLAQVLVRLDEGAADVAVLDQALAVRDAAGAGETDGRRRAGVGDGDDHVGLDQRLAGQLLAHAVARLRDVDAVDDRIRPREINVFKDAESLPLGRLDDLPQLELAVR